MVKKFLMAMLLFAPALESFAGGGAAETNAPPASTNQAPADSVREQASKGDARAQFELGIRYIAGNGVEKNLPEGIKWIQMAADQNFTRAQFVLASAYLQGQGVAKDVSQGIMWLQRAAEHGMIDAQYELGALYYEGKSVTQDYDEAVKWFQMGADYGDPASQQILGICYVNGQGVKQDALEAYKWLSLAVKSGAKGAQQDLDRLTLGLDEQQIADAKQRAATFVPKKSADNSPSYFDPEKSSSSEWGKAMLAATWPPTNAPPTVAGTGASIEQLTAAAETNDVQAQIELGIRLSRGYGVATNATEATKWFIKAAEAGYPEGRVQLAFMAIQSGNPLQMVRGLDALKRIGEAGYARAQTMVGVLNLSGTPFDKDEAEAIKWLRKAAVRDEPLATMMLGLSYTLGTNGVAKDEAEGHRWLRKAAEQDNGIAQYLLGQDLVIPKHTADEQVEGVKWLKSASEQNIMMAQVVLAGCYQSGWGTEKDPVEAFKWYKIASKQAPADPGIPPQLLEQLSPEQLADGSRRAAAFKPRRSRMAASFPIEPPLDLQKAK